MGTVSIAESFAWLFTATVGGDRVTATVKLEDRSNKPYELWVFGDLVATYDSHAAAVDDARSFLLGWGQQ